MNPNQTLTPVSGESILVLLATQKGNYPALSGLMKKHNLKPASVFLPQTLKNLDTEFLNSEELVMDCINFLDVVKIYSITVYGDSESYLESIKHFIVENRTIKNAGGQVLAEKAVDDFTFANAKETLAFLDNNKLLLATYVYSLINFTLYTES